MFQTLSYQLYTATEQHPSDLRAAHLRTGEAAAGLRDLRFRLRRAFHPAPSLRLAYHAPVSRMPIVRDTH
jgi:hypothetical protein